MENEILIQKLYIGYYGRPAEPGGLAFWVNKLEEEGLQNVLGAFANSQESAELYGEQPDSESLVTAIYQQLLNRDPDTGGLNFYVTNLDNGRFTPEEIIIAIIDGAQNEDLTLIDNKVEVSEAFTAFMDSNNLDYSGSTSTSITRALINNVPADLDELDADTVAQMAALTDMASDSPELVEALLPESGEFSDLLAVAPDGTSLAQLATLANAMLEAFEEEGNIAEFTEDNSFEELLEDLTFPDSLDLLADTIASEGTAALFPDPDITPPQVSISVSADAVGKDETLTVTFTFTEPVVGFDEADITVDNATLSDLTQTADPLVYTATLTPTDDLLAENNIVSVGTGYGDLAGNIGVQAMSSGFDIDTRDPDLVGPTVVVTIDGDAFSTGDTGLITITFSEEPVGFTAADITAEGGNRSNLQVTDNPLVYTALFTPDEDQESSGNRIIIGTDYTDAAGNSGSGATSTSYSVDTLAPELSITLSDDSLSQGDTAIVTFTFTEEPVGFTVEDVSADQGEISNFSASANPLVYTATYTPTDGIDDTSNLIRVSADYTDAQGNQGSSAFSPNYSIDTLSPTVSIAIDDNRLNIGDTATATFTFSEAPTGFTIEDITADNVTLSEFAEGSNPRVFTVLMTPDADVEDLSNTLSVTGDYTDESGNTGDGATSSNYEIDTIAPSMTISIDQTAFIKGETANVTFTFTEEPTGFNSSDISVSNGFINQFLVSDNPLVYTAVLTPDNNVESSENVLSLTGSFTDSFGNEGSGTDSQNYTIDTIAPTVEIELSDEQLSIGETSTLTFTFSSAPVGFELEDITAEQGAVSNLAATADPLVYTATFTPAADVEASSLEIIVASTYEDASGNAGTLRRSDDYSVDTIAPTLDQIVIDDTALIKGDTALVSFTFSEAVTDFTLDDIVVENGVLSNLLASGDNIVYIATLTPTDELVDDTNILTVTDSFTDLAGNAGTGLSSGNYEIETEAPTVTIAIGDTELEVDETTAVTFTFSEAPFGFSIDDITAQRGTLTNFGATADPTIYTAIFVPDEDIEDTTNKIIVGTDYTDAAGNAGTGGESPNYSIDTFINTNAAPVNSQTETLNLVATAGSVTTFGGPDVTDGEGEFASINGPNLSTLTVTGGGTMNLGVIVDIDDQIDALLSPNGFEFVSGVGVTTLTLGEGNSDGVDLAPTLSAGGAWNFEMNGAVGSSLTITEAVTFEAGDLVIDTSHDTADNPVIISGNVDFTPLNALTLSAGTVFNLDDDSTLIMSDAQFAAQALTFTGDTVIEVTQELLDSLGDDLTLLRGATSLLVDNGLEFTVTPEQAAFTQVYDSNGNLGDLGDLADAVITVQTSAAVDLTALDHDNDANTAAVSLQGISALQMEDDGNANTVYDVTVSIAEASALQGNVSKNGNTLSAEAGVDGVDANGNPVDTAALVDLTDPDGNPGTNDAYSFAEVDRLILEDDHGTVINLDQWNQLLFDHDDNANTPDIANITEADGNGNNDLVLISDLDLTNQQLDLVDDLIITIDTTITAAQAAALDSITQSDANANLTLTITDLEAEADANGNITIDLDHVVHDSNANDNVSDGVFNIVLQVDDAVDGNDNALPLTVLSASGFGDIDEIETEGSNALTLQDDDELVGRTLSGTAPVTLSDVNAITDAQIVYTGSGSLTIDNFDIGSGDSAVNASGASGDVDVLLDLDDSLGNGDSFSFQGSSGVNTVRIVADSADAADANSNANISIAGGAGTSDVLVVFHDDDVDEGPIDFFSGFEVLRIGDLDSNLDYDFTDATQFSELRVQYDATNGAISDNRDLSLDNLSAGLAANISLFYADNNDAMFDDLTVSLADASGLSDTVSINLNMVADEVDAPINAYADGNLVINGVETVSFNSGGDSQDDEGDSTENRILSNWTADSLGQITITGDVDFELGEVAVDTLTRVDANSFSGENLDVEVDVTGDFEHRGAGSASNQQVVIEAEGDVSVDTSTGVDLLTISIVNAASSDDVNVESGQGNDVINLQDDGGVIDADIETRDGNDSVVISRAGDVVVDLGEGQDYILVENISGDIDINGGNGDDLILLDLNGNPDTANIDLNDGDDVVGIIPVGDWNGNTVVVINDFDPSNDSIILRADTGETPTISSLLWTDANGIDGNGNTDTGYDVTTEIAYVSVGLASNSYILQGQAGSDETLVTEFNFDANFDGVTLNINSTGADLLNGIDTDTNANTLANLTVDNASEGYIIAYQGGDAYIFYYDAGANTNVSAAELQLIAVLDDVDSGDMRSGNFAEMFV